MNRQDAFDRAITGIIAQGQLASNEDGDCFYRHPDNSAIRCGVGHLIPDDKYDSDFEENAPVLEVEGHYVSDSAPFRLCAAIGVTEADDAKFLRKFQSAVHDHAARYSDNRDTQMKEFRIAARVFAENNDLNTKVLDNA